MPEITVDTPLKFLRAGAVGTHSGFQWPKSSGKRPGKWVHAEPPLTLCSSGIHWTTAQHWIDWSDTELYVIEVAGVTIGDDNKRASASGRLLYRVKTWSHETQVLLACDLVEHALTHVVEPDPRCAAAIGAARRFIGGQATREDLDAAGDAAEAVRNAACTARYAADAAGDAAYAARYAAYAAGDAAYAARHAAEAAWYAADAARHAADAALNGAAAARDAEREWQVERFLAYVNGVAS